MGILLRGLDALTMRPLAIVFIFSVIFPLSWASAVYTKFPILPIDETRQGNKARVPYDLRREGLTYDVEDACKERVRRWSTWNGGLEGNILIHSKDEGDMDTWSAFLVFDREVDSFSCYDGELVDTDSKSAFKVTPLGWNAESKAGSQRQIGVSVKWPQNTPEPKLLSLTVNGIPYTCSNDDDSSESGTVIEVQPVVAEVEEDRPSKPAGKPIQKPVAPAPLAPVTPVEQIANINSERGVFVPWPKKVMGLYILLADDDHEGFENNAVWQPRLYDWQQKAANVLFFTFIHPVTMDVPPAFEDLAKTRGTGVDGAIPSDTVILFAIGGYAYSSKIKPWHWLESREAAEAMAERVATWPQKYGIDGIDLDLGDGAGDTPKAGPNMIHFVKKLRKLQPKMIIGQPTYGFPQVKAEIAVINASWKDKKSTGVADSVGLMVYQGTYALNYVKNYADASKQWSGFPIKTDVPKDCILLGAKGAAGGSTIRKLADATMKNDYLGIMVWYASVRNGDGKGLQYAESWDASFADATIEAYIETGNRFRAV